ncbi:MAG: InlB B-repeat-containing protein, partial [Alphaproteobacteria bacterium]
YYYDNNNQCSAETCITGYHKADGVMSYPLSDVASVAGVDVSIVQQVFPGKTTVTEDDIKTTLTPQLISMFINDYTELLSESGLTHEQYIQTQVIDYLDIMAKGRAGLESFGISGDNILVDGDHKYIHSLNGSYLVDNANYGDLPQSSSFYDRLKSMSPGEWAVDFSYGTITGRALCSTTNGDVYKADTPDVSGTGNYCWCKMTGFTPSGGSLQSMSSSWVSKGGTAYSDADSCANWCEYNCTDIVLSDSRFRGALFGKGSAKSECVANEINVNWYNGETLYETNQCTYDGAITLPTAPEKRGYTFKGWKLQQQLLQ